MLRSYIINSIAIILFLSFISCAEKKDKSDMDNDISSIDTSKLDESIYEMSEINLDTIKDKKKEDISPNSLDEMDPNVEKMLQMIGFDKDSLEAMQKQIEIILPEHWKTPSAIAYDTDLAEVEYRYGDIDNFGYGWPPNFDPFSGEDTPKHRFPFYPEEDDPPGTDKIMVISGYNGGSVRDGYTGRTKRPDNLPEKLTLQYDLKGINVTNALLQIFVDDFQPAVFFSRYKLKLNGTEASWMNSAINELKQTGPIGKLISFQILPKYLTMVESGKLEIEIDDPDTNVGDGFAIDFVQLLVNPKNIPTSNLKGLVLDAKTKEPISGALVKITGADGQLTDSIGKFKADAVPCGMVVIQAAMAGFKSNKVIETLTQESEISLIIELEPETDKSLEKQLEEKGSVDLYGIYFDSDKDIIKPESESTLQQILALIKNNPSLKLEIVGHTDAQGDEDYNQQLSEKRANAVVKWLEKNNANPKLLTSKGNGETQPVANNDTESGRALNRRVELKKVN